MIGEDPCRDVTKDIGRLRKVVEDGRVDSEGRFRSMETWVEEMKNNHLPHITTKLCTIQDRIDAVQDRLNRGYRPPWVVVAFMMFLSCLAVGLIVARF